MPKCGTAISPDDESSAKSNVTHRMVETKVKNDNLEELVVSCKKCGIMIRLVSSTSEPQA